MVVNEYVKKWCDEDYDVRKEDFYVENAHYVAEREWAINGFKHGILAIVIAVVTAFFGEYDSMVSNIVSAIVNLGILTVCYWLFGIRQYDANSPETSFGLYVLAAIMLFIGKGKINIGLQSVFAIVSCALFVYLSVLRPIKFISIASKMKKRILEEEREEEAASKQSYSRWEGGYKAFRYGLPEPERNVPEEDPDMVMARQMFEGYDGDKQILKTRYRQLAKQYHPDKGGDTKLFQCIIAVYEELGQALA